MPDSASAHPMPTARARQLVVGAYDTHVHVAPDVMKRRIDDVTLAGRFADVGLAGSTIVRVLFTIGQTLPPFPASIGTPDGYPLLQLAI